MVVDGFFAQCQGPLYLGGQEVTVTADVVSLTGEWWLINGSERNGTCTEVMSCSTDFCGPINASFCTEEVWYVSFSLLYGSFR